MTQPLQRVFAGMLAGNLGAEGRLTYYGVRVDGVSPDGSDFDLTLIFKSGETYCCPELGCHFAYSESEWWEEIRGVMQDHGIGERPRLTIRRIRVVVQSGARLRCRADFGRPELSPRFSYERGPFIEILA